MDGEGGGGLEWVAVGGGGFLNYSFVEQNILSLTKMKEIS